VRRLFPVAVAVATGVTALLSACGGSDDGPPELLFVSSRAGDYAVYAMRRDGGNQARLTDDEGDPSSPQGLFFQFEPAWSPDGSRIAFSSKREGSFDIYAMDADGNAARRLTTTRHDDNHPSFAPDGERMVFSRGTTGDLYVMDADGSGLRPLVDDPADDTQPAWSPDGSWIAFTRRTPGTGIRELWLVRPDGTGARQLTALETVSEAPAWTPDGAHVAFATDLHNDQFDIYSVRVDGTGHRRLTVTTDDTLEPAWSPDGTTLAYSEDGSIYTKRIAADEVGESIRVTEAAGNDSSPAWRPGTAAPDSAQKIP
jgi:Tol biopolymer transport system component